MQSINLFFSAGEISGDLHAADLIRELKKVMPDLRCTGMGGKAMTAAGMELIGKDSSFYSAVGIVDSLRFAFLQLTMLGKTMEYLKKNKPNAVILVDHPGINFIIAKEAKKIGIPVFYYFPPHVSVYGRGNAPKLAKIADHIICPNFEDYQIYRQFSGHSWFCGNPLLDRVREFRPDPNFLKKYGLDPSRKIIGILPGSRFQEIETLLPPLLSAAEKLLELGHQILLPVSHPAFEKEISRQIAEKKLTGKVTVFPGAESYSVMAASDMMIVKSGTGTLEAALFHKPMIIIYKIFSLSFFIGKLIVKGGMIGLPNIILKEKVFPELLQGDCNPENLVNQTLEILNWDEAKHIEMEGRFSLIEKRLGEYPVVKKTAEKIREWLHHG